VLRPAEIEAPELGETLNREALFGAARVFSRNLGVECTTEGAALVIAQDGAGHIRLEEDGGICLCLPIAEPVERRRSHASFPAIIEETLLARITAGLGYASWLLDHVDPTQRLTHIACAAQLEAGGFMAWRTQREQDASPMAAQYRCLATMSESRSRCKNPVPRSGSTVSDWRRIC
jgi:hypothetical protein